MQSFTRRFLVLGIVLECSGLLATGLGSLWTTRSEDKLAQEEFLNSVKRGEEAVTARLGMYREGLRSAAAVYTTWDSVGIEEWESYILHLEVDRAYPGVNGFGHISYVPKIDSEAFSKQAAAQTVSFSIHGIGENPTEALFVIDRISPLVRNRPALGLDIASEINRREAAIRSRDSGKAAITKKVLLVQDKTRHPGFLMLLPIYSTAVVPGNVEDRRKSLVGWVYAPFIGRKTLEGVARSVAKSICLEVYDGIVDSTNLIYDGCPAGTGFERVQYRRMEVAGRAWTLVWKDTSEKPDAGFGVEVLLFLGIVNFLGIFWVMGWLHHASLKFLRHAEKSARAKTDFLAVMSHEIRTPLNGIIGTMGLIDRRRLDDDTRKKIGIIDDSSRGLHSLINDILDFSKIEEGRLELETAPFQPSSVLASCARLNEPIAKAKGVELNWSRLEAPATYLGDSLRVRQILLNLIGNAIKFTERGFVEVTLVESDSGIRIVVRDTGIGMDKSGLNRLFKPFTQLDASTGRRFGGTGLGLSIVKMLVDAMKGVILVESQPGKGAVFSLELPMSKTDLAPTQEGSIEVQSHELSSNAKEMKVLAVDDNDVNLLVITGQLEALGCKVRSVTSGREAIRLVAEESWDLILMDCQMPVMDGLMTTKELRRTGCKLPIIALTANAQPSDREECLAAGMDGFLSKPVKPHEIKSILEQYVQPMK
jgi:signal transduction histidine kinase/CheY-like chemotaxis protein